jgi:O-antigen/teichoic acid export membrane protein
MTRLLVPEMFGVMALVAVFMSGISMFSDIGLQQNIVQSKKGEQRVYLNTAWTIQILRGFCIFIIALLFSITLNNLNKNNLLPTDSVYTDSNLPFLLAFMSITALIGGFNSINLQLLNRKLMISKITIIEILSQVVGLSSMLLVAYYWREVWVLVIAGIVSSLVKMILSHHRSLGQRPNFALDKNSVKEIVGFGKWIFLGSILGFLLSQGDRLLLGGFINSELLGIYSIAFFMANALKGALKKLIWL